MSVETPVLSIRDIHKSYNGKAVLSGCSFDFESGVYALIGPNGSGKSTLLRILALLEPPDRGSVSYYFESEDIEHKPEYGYEEREPLEYDISLRRKITLVLPKPALFNTTVYGNAAYGLKVRGMSKSLIKEKIHSILETVGLLEMKDRSALALSSGEAQRLALARAMAVEPRMLLLDEPTAYLDERNSEIIEELILKMKTEGSPAVVLATHDRDLTEWLPDKVLALKDGAIKNP